MGAAESRLESPLGLGENPFANVKVAWTPPPAPTAEEQEDRQKEKEMEHGRGKSRHKSPAQRKIGYAQFN
eukprot:1161142-Pelagomonas_calceolata.AAC.1